MSNIVVTERTEDIGKLPADILQAPLTSFVNNQIFSGRYEGPRRDALEQSFESNLAKLYAASETPRLSGVQIKAPMCLQPSGNLVSATDHPFTHILKPAGTSGFEALPLVEWMGLTLGRHVGFDVPEFALVPMPDDMMPALVVERFDIRTSQDDKRCMALEDFCSLLDLSPSDKYRGTVEQSARALRGLSTSPDEDILILWQRALFAWLIADGDMHLKNLAVLKVAMPGENLFSSVQMAPLYDSVTTVVFPGLKHDRMAMKLNGKDAKLKCTDFMRSAATMGLKSGAAEQALEIMLERLERGIEKVVLPDLVEEVGMKDVLLQILDICHERIKGMQS